MGSTTKNPVRLTYVHSVAWTGYFLTRMWLYRVTLWRVKMGVSELYFRILCPGLFPYLQYRTVWSLCIEVYLLFENLLLFH